MRIGIQIKLDNPIFKISREWDEPKYESPEPDGKHYNKLVQAFGIAYGLPADILDRYRREGLIQVELMQDGSVLVYFLTDLQPEEIGKAFHAIKMFEQEKNISS